jgi:hypothetical protein
MELAKRNAFCPIPELFRDDIHSPRMALACGANVHRMRLLSTPNPADELLESLHLGTAEIFPKPIFGFLPSVVRGIVCQQTKLKLFHDLSSREFRACGSLS